MFLPHHLRTGVTDVHHQPENKSFKAFLWIESDCQVTRNLVTDSPFHSQRGPLKSHYGGQRDIQPVSHCPLPHMLKRQKMLSRLSEQPGISAARQSLSFLNCCPPLADGLRDLCPVDSTLACTPHLPLFVQSIHLQSTGSKNLLFWVDRLFQVKNLST